MIWPSQSLQKTFKDMKTIQLTKQSSENEVKDYFKAVLKLAKSKEEFPVNLEDV